MEETLSWKDSHAILHNRLVEWFDQAARPLPWRETTDPYHIWLSEVILQQTQVVQGMSYYHRFIEAFPTVYDLAAASEDEVLRLWQGLGYYSRGRNLLRAAKMVVEEFGGQLPRQPRELARLPGVGPYTQAAVLSFAYDLPYAAVDGNVYRVLSRLDACTVPIDTTQGQRHYRQRAQELINSAQPGKHNQAMIELGALVCTPRRPDCMACPLEGFCLACHQGTPEVYPIKAGRTRVTERYLNYLLILLEGGDMLIRRRGAGDIWQGLYDLPLIETETHAAPEELLCSEEWQVLARSLPGATIAPGSVSRCTHRLTHRLLHGVLYVVSAREYIPMEGLPYQRIGRQDFEAYAKPRLIERLLESI